MIDSAAALVPEPDSPTIPTVSPRRPRRRSEPVVRVLNQYESHSLRVDNAGAGAPRRSATMNSLQPVAAGAAADLAAAGREQRAGDPHGQERLVGRAEQNGARC